MGTVIQFKRTTTGNIPTETVLDSAKGIVDPVIVIRWTRENGQKDLDLYIASSTSDSKEILWLLEEAKHCLLNQGFIS